MNLRLMLLGTLCLGALLAVRLVGWPLVRVNLAPPAATQRPQDSPLHQAPIESLSTTVSVRDPFRLTRRPAEVAYDLAQASELSAPPVPKPTLQLAGIVWEGGRDPTALLLGLPGVEGVRVVRVGDLVGGLRIRSITADAVRIAGLDTMWVLKVREPWR